VFKGTDYTFALLALLSLAGVLALLDATRAGVGISPDSTVYLGAARNLSDGRGLTALDGRTLTPAPLTHYPPLYPTLLSIVAAASGAGDPLHVARWINVLLFGVNIFLVGASVKAYAPRARWLPLAGALLVLAAPDMLQIHSMAWTEPLFITFSLTGLLLLARYLDTQRTALLHGATLAVALALLTRYVGVVGVATLGCGLLLYGRKTFSRRLLEASVCMTLAALPLALWMVRNMSFAGDATNRKMAFHPVGWRHLTSALSTVSTWLLLGKVRGDIRAAFFLSEMLAFGVLCVYLWRKKRRPRGEDDARRHDEGARRHVDNGARRYDDEARRGDDARRDDEGLSSASRLPQLLLIFNVLYIAFLVFTASFIDFDTVFDERSLAPVHVFSIVILLCAAHRFLPRAGGLRRVRRVLVAACLALVVSHLFRGAVWIVERRDDAQGYAGRSWRQAEIVGRLRELPVDAPIYTNGFDAVYFLTGRAALMIPSKVDRGTGRENANYASELAAMREQLETRGGVLVYFENLGERFYLPTADELRAGLSLRETLRTSGGAIYEVPPEFAPR
jgi:hypothetical protein